MGHDESEQLEERTGLPREGVIVETVGVPDLGGVKQIALRAHPHDTSPPDALFGSLRQSVVCEPVCWQSDHGITGAV